LHIMALQEHKKGFESRLTYHSIIIFAEPLF